MAGLAACDGSEAREGPATGQEHTCGPAEVVAFLDPRLREASGIVRDPRRDGLFWLHNDSGNEALLFAVDSSGASVVTVGVSGATDLDIEDIATGRCGSGWCLYLGDIGDNRAVRPSIGVHVIPLPDLPASVPPHAAEPVSTESTVSPLRTLQLRYPDGPRDAEGILVDDLHRELIIITKGREAEVVMYALDLATRADPDDAEPLLTRIGRLNLPIGANTSQYVTAADLSPDGDWLAVRSYANLFLLPWKGTAQLDTLAVPQALSLLSALEPQGEGLAWAASGDVLYLASEGRGGRPPQLSRIRCRSR